MPIVIGGKNYIEALYTKGQTNQIDKTSNCLEWEIKWK